MLIIGAKGFAKEVLEIVHQNGTIDKLNFYDDVNEDLGDTLFDTFPILKSLEQAQSYFRETDDSFTLGVGGPAIRQLLYNKFVSLGGQPVSVISGLSDIGHYGVKIGEACTITAGVRITNDIVIGKGSLLNLNVTVGHDSTIGEFVEICPNVSISGNCEIGDFTFVGTGAIILPKIKIGKNVVIAAGAVVNKDVPDNVLIAGVPAVIKGTISK